jgi:hypothetical protein
MLILYIFWACGVLGDDQLRTESLRCAALMSPKTIFVGPDSDTLIVLFIGEQLTTQQALRDLTADLVPDIAAHAAAAVSRECKSVSVVAIGPSMSVAAVASVIDALLQSNRTASALVAIGETTGKFAAAVSMFGFVAERSSAIIAGNTTPATAQRPPIYTDYSTTATLGEWEVLVPVSRHWSEDPSSTKKRFRVHPIAASRAVHQISETRNRVGDTVTPRDIVVVPRDCPRPLDSAPIERQQRPEDELVAWIGAQAQRLVDSQICVGTEDAMRALFPVASSSSAIIATEDSHTSENKFERDCTIRLPQRTLQQTSSDSSNLSVFATIFVATVVVAVVVIASLSFVIHNLRMTIDTLSLRVPRLPPQPPATNVRPNDADPDWRWPQDGW